MKSAPPYGTDSLSLRGPVAALRNIWDHTRLEVLYYSYYCHGHFNTRPPPPLRLFCAGVSWGRVWGQGGNNKRLAECGDCSTSSKSSKSSNSSSVSCLPNCTLLAGLRVLLVSAFASLDPIFFGIWGPEYFHCHPLNYCHPPPFLHQ